jgi:hypothetical protein
VEQLTHRGQRVVLADRLGATHGLIAQVFEKLRLGENRRAALSRALDRVRQAAQASGMRVTARWHHVHASARLREAYDRLKHDAAPGVDGQTWAAYGAQRDTHRRDLADRR